MCADCNKRTLLTSSTLVFSCSSFACLSVAVCTDYWLHAVERREVEGSTTGNVTVQRTTTGLWRRCTNYDFDVYPRWCGKVVYFSQESKDGLGPTDAIILSMQRATLFPLLSLLILLAAQIVCFTSHCYRRRTALTFVSGILFVIAGLCTLIGMILFIGAITEEAGGKAKSPLDAPRFEYSYGASFVLTVVSFSCAELTGVLSVYLYISRHKHDLRKKIEGLQDYRPSALPFTERDGGSAPDPPEGENSLCLPGAAEDWQGACNGAPPAYNNSFYSLAHPAPGAQGGNGLTVGVYRENGGSEDMLNCDRNLWGVGGGMYGLDLGRAGGLGGRLESNGRLGECSAADNYRRTTPV